MLYMDIDRSKVNSLGVSDQDVNQTLQIYLGSLYVNNFNLFGRYWQVNIQAEGSSAIRCRTSTKSRFATSSGSMVPLSTLVRMSDVGGPVMVTRYNLYHVGSDQRHHHPAAQLGRGHQDRRPLGRHTSCRGPWERSGPI